MAEKSVLVTGATGFLGGAVCRWLQLRGWRVIGVGRNQQAGAKLVAEGISFRSLDLAVSPEQLAEAFASCGEGVYVVHSAALSAPWGPWKQFYACNVLGTEAVLRNCHQYSATRLVAISTPAVQFAYEMQRDLKEEIVWQSAPANSYVASKRIAEELLRKAELPFGPPIILRPKALFGPGDTSLMPRVLKLARRGLFPQFGDDVLLDLTWIDDACVAVELALEARQAEGPYFITSGQPTSRNAVFEALFEAASLGVTQPRISRGISLATGSSMEWLSRLFTFGRSEPPLTRYTVGTLAFGQTLDISAARRDLGYEPRTDVLDRIRQVAFCAQ
jgi:nucleoside-diphosphate-sugar epimerase